MEQNQTTSIESLTSINGELLKLQDENDDNANIDVGRNTNFEKEQLLADSPKDEIGNAKDSKLNPLSKTIRKFTPVKARQPKFKNKIKNSVDKAPSYVEPENEDGSTTIEDNDVLFGKFSAEKGDNKTNAILNPLPLNNGVQSATPQKESDNESSCPHKEIESQIVQDSFLNRNSETITEVSISNNEVITRSNFEIKRVWFDYGRKDILFEVCLDKDDDEKRSIVSRRELAKKDQPLLLCFYEKCLDYSTITNASGFKLKEPLTNSFLQQS